MNGLRKDYVLDRWVVISPKRGKRPYDFKESVKTIQNSKKNCVFCPGNEHLTPKGGVFPKKGKWKIRFFKNKYSAFENNGKEDKEKAKDKINNFLVKTKSYGYHEIIVDTRYHKKHLYDLKEKELEELLKVYIDRINKIKKLKNISYVSLFKNHGAKSGASISHSHSQIIGLNSVPRYIKERLDAIKKYKSCPYCKIIEIERKSKRFCFENNSFIAFTPFASRFNYEIWIFPKKHLKNFTKLNNKEIIDLAKIFKKVFIKLKELGISFVFYLNDSPNKSKNNGFHFNIEICPIISKSGGFGIGTGITINTVTPEKAAEFYRQGYKEQK